MKLSVNDCNKLIKDLGKMQVLCKKKNPQLNDMSILCINKLQALKDSSGADILRGDFLYILVPFLYAIESNLFGKSSILLLEDVHVILQSFLLSLNSDEFKNKDFYLNGLFDDCMVYDLSDACSVSDSNTSMRGGDALNHTSNSFNDNKASNGGDDNNTTNNNESNMNSNDNGSNATIDKNNEKSTTNRTKKDGKVASKKYVGIFNKHPTPLPEEQPITYKLSTPSDILKFLIDTYLTILNTHSDSDVLIKVLQTLSSIIPLLYGKYLFKIFYNVVSIFDNSDRRLYSVLQAVVLQIVCGVFDRFEKLYKYFSFKNTSESKNIFIDNAKTEHVPNLSNNANNPYGHSGFSNCDINALKIDSMEESKSNVGSVSSINDKIDNILDTNEIINTDRGFENTVDNIGVYNNNTETENNFGDFVKIPNKSTSLAQEIFLEQCNIKENNDLLNENTRNDLLIKRIRTVSIDCARMLKDIYKLLCQPIVPDFSYITMISLDMLLYALKNKEIFKNNHSREVLYKIPEQLYNIKRYVGMEYMYLNYNNFNNDDEEQKDQIIDLDNISRVSLNSEHSRLNTVTDLLKNTSIFNHNHNDLSTLKFLHNRNIPLIYTDNQSSFKKESESFGNRSGNNEKEMISERINKIFIKLIKEYSDILSTEVSNILRKEVSILADPKFISLFDDVVVKKLDNEELYDVLFVSTFNFFSYSNIPSLNKKNLLQNIFLYVKENEIDVSSCFFEFFVVLFIDAYKMGFIKSNDKLIDEYLNKKDNYAGSSANSNNLGKAHKQDDAQETAFESFNSSMVNSNNKSVSSIIRGDEATHKNLFMSIINYLLPILMQKCDFRLLQVIIKDDCILEIIQIIISYKEHVTNEWIIIFDEILSDNYLEKTKFTSQNEIFNTNQTNTNVISSIGTIDTMNKYDSMNTSDVKSMSKSNLRYSCNKESFYDNLNATLSKQIADDTNSRLKNEISNSSNQEKLPLKKQNRWLFFRNTKETLPAVTNNKLVEKMHKDIPTELLDIGKTKLNGLKYILDKSQYFKTHELENLFFSTRNTSVLKMLYTKNIKKMCYTLQSVIYCLLRFYNDIEQLCDFILEYFKNLSDFDTEIEKIPFLFVYSRVKCLDILSVMKSSKLLSVTMFIYKNSYLFENYGISNKSAENLLLNHVTTCGDDANNTTSNISNEQNKPQPEDNTKTNACTVVAQTAKIQIDCNTNAAFITSIAVKPSTDEMKRILELISFLLRIHNDKIKQSWSYIFIIIEETSNYKQLLEINFKVCQIISENNISLLNIQNKRKLLYAYCKIATQSENFNYILQILGMLNDLKIHFSISDNNNYGKTDDGINTLSIDVKEDSDDFKDDIIEDNNISNENGNNDSDFVEKDINLCENAHTTTNNVKHGKNNMVHHTDLAQKHMPSITHYHYLLDDSPHSLHTAFSKSLWLDFVKTIQKIIGNSSLNGWNDIYETGTRIIIDYLLLHTNTPNEFLQVIYNNILPSFLMQIQKKLVFTNVIDKRFSLIDMKSSFAGNLNEIDDSKNCELYDSDQLNAVGGVLDKQLFFLNKEWSNPPNNNNEAIGTQNICNTYNKPSNNQKTANGCGNIAVKDVETNNFGIHPALKNSINIEGTDISHLSVNELFNSLRMTNSKAIPSVDLYETTLRNKETYQHVIEQIHRFLKNTREMKEDIAYYRFVFYFQSFIKYFCTLEIESSQRAGIKWRDELLLFLIDILESTITKNFQAIYFDLCKSIILLENNAIYFKEDVYVKLIKHGADKNVNLRNYKFYDSFTRFLLTGNVKIRDSVFELINNDINNDIFLIYIKWMDCLDNQCVKILLKQIEKKLFSNNIFIYNLEDCCNVSNDISIKVNGKANNAGDNNLYVNYDNNANILDDGKKNLYKAIDNERRKNIIKNNDMLINNPDRITHLEPKSFITPVDNNLSSDEKLDSLPEEIFDSAGNGTFSISDDISECEVNSGSIEKISSQLKYNMKNTSRVSHIKKNAKSFSIKNNIENDRSNEPIETSCDENSDKGVNKFSDILSRFNNDFKSSTNSDEKNYFGKKNQSSSNSSESKTYLNSRNLKKSIEKMNNSREKIDDVEKNIKKIDFDANSTIINSEREKSEKVIRKDVLDIDKFIGKSSNRVEPRKDTSGNKTPKSILCENQSKPKTIDIYLNNTISVNEGSKTSVSSEDTFDIASKESRENNFCKKDGFVINGQPFNSKNVVLNAETITESTPTTNILPLKNKIMGETIQKLMRTLIDLKKNDEYWENIIYCFKGISIIIRNYRNLVEYYIDSIKLIFENELAESKNDDIVTFFGSIVFNNKNERVKSTFSKNEAEIYPHDSKMDQADKESLSSDTNNKVYAEKMRAERSQLFNNPKTGFYALNNVSSLIDFKGKNRCSEDDYENQSVDSRQNTSDGDYTNMGYVQRRKEKLLIELIEYYTSTVSFHFHNNNNHHVNINYNRNTNCTENALGNDILHQKNSHLDNNKSNKTKTHDVSNNAPLELYKIDKTYKSTNVFQENIKETPKNTIHPLNREFTEKALYLIEKLSFVKINNYRENLSMSCIQILFKYSEYTSNMLIDRIKSALENYVKEECIYRDLYPRVKRNEVYLIIDSVIKHPFLIKHIKHDLIECLSVKDFNVIEKIKTCLKYDV